MLAPRSLRPARTTAADPTAAPPARTALVTGASSGIGRAIALRLAGAGLRVFGTSRDEHPEEPPGTGIEMVVLDVTDDRSVDRCVDTVLARAGQIDVLVNNAGVLHEGIAEETTPEQAERVFDTNLFGVSRVTNAVLPGMRARGQGRIVNMGSLAAWVGEPGTAFYAASKAALARYTEALHHEVSDLGIDVSLVECGAFATNILPAASESAGHIPDYRHTRRAARRALHSRLADGDDPAEIASVVLDIVRDPVPRLRHGASPAARRLPVLTVLMPEWLATLRLRRSLGLRRSRRHTR